MPLDSYKTFFGMNYLLSME